MRIFILSIDPWASADQFNEFGHIDCLQTASFELPDSRTSMIKKVCLLIGNDDGTQDMYLLFQYEKMLWSVPLIEDAKAKLLLPTKDLEMIKRPMIRNKEMDSSVICGAFNPKSQDYCLLKVMVNEERAGEVLMEEVHTNENAKIIAFEVDPEYPGYFYSLDDEQ